MSVSLAKSSKRMPIKPDAELDATSLQLRKPCRVLEPWDIVRGSCFDVIKHEDALDADLESATVAHFAPNCATFSGARNIPIPGVVNPPVPLRSEEFPEGLPGIPSRHFDRMNNDTITANMSAVKCLNRHRCGKLFSLEHPERSLAHHLSSWKTLRQAKGVFVTKNHHCMFPPCRRKKSQVLIHNIKGLDAKLNRICSGSIFCDRTQMRHLTFKPAVKSGRVVSFPTSNERIP